MEDRQLEKWRTFGERYGASPERIATLLGRMQMTVPDSVVKLVVSLRKVGGTVYIVGGFVRDRLMWRSSKDIDLEVYGLTVEAVHDTLVQHPAVKSLNSVGRSFGVFKVGLEDGSTVDLSMPRTENKVGQGHRGFMVTPDPNLTPKDAAARRDFTMNALLMDPITKEITDFYGGQADILAGKLRHTSAAFSEDPLRVLRAMQFASRFNMTLDWSTAALCQNMLDQYHELPVERVWPEWQKWAMGMTPSLGIEVLKATGWLHLYPQLSLLDGCRQDMEWHPEGDVLTHSMHAVNAAACIAAREKLNDEDRVVLVLAALCHDMGKPTTTSRDDEGRIISHGHDQAGIGISDEFLKSIGAPESVRSRVTSLVGEHMWGLSNMMTKRSVRRLCHRLGQAGNTVHDWARLVEADASGRPPLPRRRPGHAVLAVEDAGDMKLEASGPKPLLMGRHLIEVGFVPGPHFTTILTSAMEAQLDGQFETLDGAQAWLASYMKGEIT